MEFDDYEEDSGPDRIERKGVRRREAEAMKRLGDALVALAPEQLVEIPLPEQIAEAIALAHRITAHGGRRRQLALIGKLMRHTDAEPIQEALDRLEAKNALGVAEHHQTERWRDRLLSEGDSAITDFLARYHAVDRQRLRQLVRAAQQEQQAGKPPKSARELFRLIRGALSED